MEPNDQIHCPKCGSTQITANKKGFSGRKAVAGAVLTGGIGILAGTIGSKKIIITCLNCGKQFKPGEGASTAKTLKPKIVWNEEATKQHEPKANNNRANNKVVGKVFAPIFGIFGIILLLCSAYVIGGIFLFIGLFFLAMGLTK